MINALKSLTFLIILTILVVIDKYPDGRYFWFTIDNTGRNFEYQSEKDYASVFYTKMKWIQFKNKMNLQRQWRYVDAYKYQIEEYVEKK